MPEEHPEEILVGLLRPDISLRVFKHTDQEDIVKIGRQIRLDIPEIAHMDRHIAAGIVADGVDLTAFPGKIHTGHLARLGREHPRNGTAAAAHLQNALRPLHGDPLHDVAALSGKVIKDRPALFFFDDGLILRRRMIAHDPEDLVLHLSVAVEIDP